MIQSHILQFAGEDIDKPTAETVDKPKVPEESKAVPEETPAETIGLSP